MSTRAFIGIKNADNTETGIYCHYGEDSLDCLRRYFATEKDVNKLLGLGAVSAIFTPEEKDLADGVIRMYSEAGNSWHFECLVVNGCTIIRYLNRNGGVDEPAYTIGMDELPFDMCEINFMFDPDTKKWAETRY